MDVSNTGRCFIATSISGVNYCTTIKTTKDTLYKVLCIKAYNHVHATVDCIYLFIFQPQFISLM